MMQMTMRLCICVMYTMCIVPHRSGDKSGCETMTLYEHLSCGRQSHTHTQRCTRPHARASLCVCKLQLNNGEKYGGTSHAERSATCGFSSMYTRACKCILFGANGACCVSEAVRACVRASVWIRAKLTARQQCGGDKIAPCWSCGAAEPRCRPASHIYQS